MPPGAGGSQGSGQRGRDPCAVRTLGTRAKAETTLGSGVVETMPAGSALDLDVFSGPLGPVGSLEPLRALQAHGAYPGGWALVLPAASLGSVRSLGGSHAGGSNVCDSVSVLDSEWVGARGWGPHRGCPVSEQVRGRMRDR